MNLRKGKLQTQCTIVDGLSIFARVSAEMLPQNAPIIILIHGLILSSRYMIPTAELLAANYRVYALDLPGYGESEKPEKILDLPELADVIARWMDATGIKKATFLGNSMGCQIIAELAMRHPQRIERAILQGPTVDPRGRSLFQQIWRFLLNAPGEDYSQAPIQIQDYWLAGLPRCIATIQIALYDRVEAKLPYLRVPTLVVRGDKDPVVPQQWAQEVVDLLPQGQLKVIAGGAHTLNYSKPLELTQAVEAFIKATESDLITTEV
ncbi:alpha/beta fold hydrolase [Gloeothece verrucosa]|uniref:Alpha/beta hydrolase fold protein n=1 Tax=Gloeothece verrucosa (strain PCC 7822) TaxID=497965 RepID=E0UBU6_GLOV7|nr:alpha/beta hydrolase [Gloeothece verrucosa]ADN15161.1 alpha/beta hydrolase fold protein [Gloeothece verrucosa PCC 7822]